MADDFSDEDAKAVPHSLDVGLSLSDQGAPHGATFSVSHNVFWPPWGGIEVGLSLRCSTGVACPPLDDRAWWLEIWYTTDSVGHGGRIDGDENLRKEMTPWAGNQPLVLHRGVPPTVYGCYAPIRDRGCHVDASGSGKCATARDRGCIYDSDLEKEALVLPWVYFLPVVDTVDLVETVGAMSALPLQARVGLTGAVGAMSTIGWLLESTLAHISSQGRIGSRDGLSVHITGFCSNMTDWDQGCKGKLPGSGNCGTPCGIYKDEAKHSNTRGCNMDLSRTSLCRSAPTRLTWTDFPKPDLNVLPRKMDGCWALIELCALSLMTRPGLSRLCNIDFADCGTYVADLARLFESFLPSWD
ncbi:hypothetical protein V6N13_148925 [Hibiscus sabdariffa]